MHIRGRALNDMLHSHSLKKSEILQYFAFAFFEFFTSLWFKWVALLLKRLWLFCLCVCVCAVRACVCTCACVCLLSDLVLFAIHSLLWLLRSLLVICIQDDVIFLPPRFYVYGQCNRCGQWPLTQTWICRELQWASVSHSSSLSGINISYFSLQYQTEGNLFENSYYYTSVWCRWWSLLNSMAHDFTTCYC